MGKSKQYNQHNLLREHSNKLPTVTSPDRTQNIYDNYDWHMLINEDSDAIHLYINTNTSLGKLKRRHPQTRGPWATSLTLEPHLCMIR